jgi:hypothetical protein
VDVASRSCAQHARKDAGKELTPAKGVKVIPFRLVQAARLGVLAGFALALDLPAIAFEIRSSSEPSPASLITAWMVSASSSRDLTAMHGLPGWNSSGVPPQ